MSELRTPDALSTTEDNELICEKLLGWKVSSVIGYWFPSQDHAGTRRTPSFTTWADAGLILDALHARDVTFEVYRDGGGTLRWNVVIAMCTYVCASSGPAAVRECALKYIRRRP